MQQANNGLPITGDTLKGWGFDPGPWFKNGLSLAQAMAASGTDDDQIKSALAEIAPTFLTMAETPIKSAIYLDPVDEIEQGNFDAVLSAMHTINRIPTVRASTIMPDACPAGVIPVGAVVATHGTIHPGYHSADICCSMHITTYSANGSAKDMLNAAQDVTHFGYGTRPRSDVQKSEYYDVLQFIVAQFKHNPFLEGLEDLAYDHFMTQGDGNHFLFVGNLEKSEKLAMVTHHGSRGLGAALFKRGMAAAKRYTKKVARGIPEAHSWLDIQTDEGTYYWSALRKIELWTALNHRAIHREVAHRLAYTEEQSYGNAHNFVFQRDELFYHAKGATPSWEGTQLIPMNMAEPILITAPNKARPFGALGFAPHGAGRNFSRAHHFRMLGDVDPSEVFAKETQGLDARSFSGAPDLSELPSAYKSAQQVQGQIAKYNLTKVIDRVMPYGSIMAGKLPEFWRN